MSKSQIVLTVLIIGVLWVSKDYLSTKKDLVVSQVDEIRGNQPRETSSHALREFEN